MFILTNIYLNTFIHFQNENQPWMYFVWQGAHSNKEVLDFILNISCKHFLSDGMSTSEFTGEDSYKLMLQGESIYMIPTGKIF